jgi:uncharacterized repeat protein (TIGR02543 family)
MLTHRWKKGCVLGIIVLFFSTCLVPVLQADPIAWDVQIILSEPGGSTDYVVFGEALDANDGAPADSHDTVKPPAPIPSYVRAWLSDSLPTPYDVLWKDYRHYPAVSKVWNVTVQWMPSGSASSTMVTLSWDTSAVNHSEYVSVMWCTETGAPLRDMRTNHEYTFSCTPYVPQNFKIICSGETNQPPNTPSDPSPPDTATGVSLSTQLSWVGGDPDVGDTVSYDVYFGTNPVPITKVAANQSTTMYPPGGLAYETQYFWRIVAWDIHGAMSSGPIWSFLTQEESVYTLTITIVGSGGVDKVPDQPTYSSGAMVQLTATAAPGWSFEGWSGDLSGSSNPTSITMDEDKTVMATFLQDVYTLTVTMDPVVGGSLVSAVPSPPYHYGDVVSVTVSANQGYSFSHWSGDASGSSSVTTVTMHGDRTAVAHFTQDMYTLSVNIIGTGSVMKDPDQTTYTHGAVVQLTAVADPRWTFSQWSGDLTGITNPTTITLDEGKTVTAIFTQNEYILTVAVVGAGNVTKQPEKMTYHYHEMVLLNASPDPGWSFAGWSQNLTGTTNPASLMIEGNTTVTATFIQQVYTLTIMSVGSGSVRRVPDQGTYHYADVVQLTATADPGWVFAGWSGDLTGMVNQTTITMDGNKTVSAIFTLPEENHPPNTPSGPWPLNGATCVSIPVLLSWVGGDPDLGDAVTYDVFFGSIYPLVKVMSNQSTTTYSPGPLDYNTRYYWRIVSWDSHGVMRFGPLWTFKTQQSLNQPPDTPILTGPTTLTVKHMGTYIASTTDPNGDKIQYRFDWDGAGKHRYSGWTSFTSSGTSKIMSHTWIKPGMYVVKVQARDKHGFVSSWSNGLTVTVIPNQSPNTPILTGPTHLIVRHSGTYIGITTDPNGDKIQYRFDWDAAWKHRYSGWTSFTSSGTSKIMNHQWNRPGMYVVKVQARDKHGLLSNWSAGLTVIVNTVF